MNSYDNNGQINNYNNSYMNEPEQRKIPYVTAVLVAINVVVFLVMEFFGSTESGEYMYAHGASYAPDIFVLEFTRTEIKFDIIHQVEKN